MSKKGRTVQSRGECCKEEPRRTKNWQKRMKKEEKNGRKKSGDGQRLKKGRENNRSAEKVREVQGLSEIRESWADGTEQRRKGVEMKEQEGQRIRKKREGQSRLKKGRDGQAERGE